MKGKIMSMVANFMSSAAAIALMVAVANANSTCIFWSYQPDVPDALQD